MTSSGRAPSGQAGRSPTGAATASPPSGDHPSRNPLAAKLRKAKAFVERGWTRHEFAHGNRVCAYGAINAAVNGDPWKLSEEADVVRNALKAALPRNEITVASWNDKQKTKRPVLAAFDRAIELAEQSA